MLHAQNLTEGRLPLWRHGRAWLGRWRAEWSVFMGPRFGFHVRQGGYRDNEIQVWFGLVFFEVFLSREFARGFRERQLGLEVHDGSVWVKLWCDGERIRDRPWHRNVVCFHVKDWIIGVPRFSQTQGDWEPALVPMPEGCYKARVRREVCRWTYRFGFFREAEDYWLEVLAIGGIPFSGKGENSWDCGDDGLCGIGGKTREAAVGNAVASVLKNRRRYGTAGLLRGFEPVLAPARYDRTGGAP